MISYLVDGDILGRHFISITWSTVLIELIVERFVMILFPVVGMMRKLIIGVEIVLLRRVALQRPVLCWNRLFSLEGIHLHLWNVDESLDLRLGDIDVYRCLEDDVLKLLLKELNLFVVAFDDLSELEEWKLVDDLVIVIVYILHVSIDWALDFLNAFIFVDQASLDALLLLQ